MTARRTATVLAAIGMLVMSSGAALMMTSSSAGAAPGDNAKYFVCKYVGTPGVDETLQTGQNPISISGSAIPLDPVVVGSFFADQHGRSYVLAVDVGQPEPPVSECPPAEAPTPTTATVTFQDPTCENENTADYAASGEGIDFVLDGTVAPGETVTVTATAQDGFVLEGESEFTHTFGAAEDCTVTEPPVVEPPVVEPPVVEPPAAETETPTVVHAGLASDLTQRYDSQDGLALLVAGMIIMMIAAGLGLVRPDGGISQK